MPVDRELFSTAHVQVGAFRCPPDDPSFEDSGPIRNFCFVFPRNSVVITHRDSRPFVSDPTIVTLYNRNQRYRRNAVSADGDRCDWFAVSAGPLRDAIHCWDERSADAEDRPIRFELAPSDAETYRRQRELFILLSNERKPDPLFVEEEVLTLLHRVLSNAYRGERKKEEPEKTRSRDLAAATRRLLANRFHESLSLSDLAAEVGTSVFHLCRAFQRSTGTTLHAYREELRLRSALERLESSADLTTLALDLGYSSHSHFTARFRRLFDVSPSKVRGTFARRSTGTYLRRT